MTGVAYPSMQAWIGEALYSSLGTAQRVAARDARTHVFARFPDDGAASAAARQYARDAVRDLCTAWSQGTDPVMVLQTAADDVDAAQRQMTLAIAAAQALAAMQLRTGESEVATARVLGINQMTLRRWFGKSATPVSRRR